MSYITAADIRAYLQQVGPDQDPLLTVIAARATDIVNQVLGFSFDGYVTETRAVMGDGTRWLWLPPHQPGSVTEVRWGSVVIPTTLYREQDGMLVYLPGQFLLAYPHATWGHMLYDVTAAWGYGAPPPSVVEITLEVAVNIWRRRDAGMFETIGVEGAGAIRFVGGLTPQQEAILRAVRQRYRVGVTI